MGKSIVNKTNKNEIRANIEAFKGRIIDSLIQRLSYIGEECVRVARQRGNYNDITGNLRSSIGYTILLNGNEVIRGASADYRKVTKSDKNGVDEGKKLLDKIKEVLKTAGKQAAISLCESHLPFGNIYCGPIIDGLIH